MAKINIYRSLLASDRVIGWDIKMASHPNSNASFINIWDRLIWRLSPNLTRSSKLAAAPNWLQSPPIICHAPRPHRDGVSRHDWSHGTLINPGIQAACVWRPWTSKDQQCVYADLPFAMIHRLRMPLKIWPTTMFEAANFERLRWLLTACHEQLAYFHWPQ